MDFKKIHLTCAVRALIRRRQPSHFRQRLLAAECARPWRGIDGLFKAGFCLYNREGCLETTATDQHCAASRALTSPEMGSWTSSEEKTTNADGEGCSEKNVVSVPRLQSRS